MDGLDLGLGVVEGQFWGLGVGWILAKVVDGRRVWCGQLKVGSDEGRGVRFVVGPMMVVGSW